MLKIWPPDKRGFKTLCGILGLLAFIAIVSLQPAWAKETPGVPEKIFNPSAHIVNNELTFVPSISDILKNLVGFMDKGDALAVGEQIEKLQEWRKRLASGNLFFISKYLMLMADQFARSGNLKKAVETAKDAVAISPDYHLARLGLAKYSFSLDKANVKGYAQPLAFALLVYIKDIRNLKTVLYRSIMLFLPALFVAYVIYLIAAILAFRKALANDIRRMMPFEMGSKSAGLLFAIVIFAIAAGAGVFIAAIVVPLFLLGYMKDRGRTVILLFLAAFALSPLLAEPLSRAIAVEKSGSARMIALYRNWNWEPGTIMALERVIASQPENAEVLFALSSLYRKMQNFTVAENYLNRIIKKNGKDVRAIVELGNVFFSKEKYKEAEAYYKKALELSPNLVEGHYNLSNTYYELLNTAEGAKEFGLAMNIDKKKTESFIKKSGDDKTTKVVSFVADLSNLEIIDSPIKKDAQYLYSSVWTFTSGGIKRSDFFMGAAVYAVFFFVIASIWRRSGAYANCTQCGTPFLPPFSGGGKEVIKCNQCLVLSTSKKKQSLASKRNRKLAQIREYRYQKQNMASRMNMLFPGFGSVYRGDYLGGAIFLCVASVFLVKLASILGPLAVGYRPDFAGNVYAYAAWGASLLLFYLVSIIFARKES